MPNFHNRTLLLGENLQFLRRMDRDTIDLAIFDPPFQMHRRSQAVPDDPLVPPGPGNQMNLEKDVPPEELDYLWNVFPQTLHIMESAYHTHSPQMKAFMAFAAIRLVEIRELMKATASLHFQCALANNHHCRTLLDAIFGKESFQGQIIWAKPGTENISHHVVLLYSKSETVVLNHKPALSKPVLLLWNDIKPESRKRTPHGDFITPVDLYSRLIALSSNKGDMVLDAFAGTGSALIAAEQADRQWIGIEAKEETHREILKRLGPAARLKGDQYTTVRELPDPEAEYSPPTPRKRIPNRTFKSVLLRHQGMVCQGCSQPFRHESHLTVDHVLARSHNGSNTLDNMTLLCRTCNSIKGDNLTLPSLIRKNHQKGLLKFNTMNNLLLLHQWHKPAG